MIFSLFYTVSKSSFPTTFGVTSLTLYRTSSTMFGNQVMMTTLIIGDRGKHARCDDVVHIFMVKFETYQIQMGATISNYMFCTYKLWTP
jgi:hypothetical protein